MSPLMFILASFAWIAGCLGALVVLRKFVKLERERVFELWSMSFYLVLCGWIAIFLARDPATLFSRLEGDGDGFVAAMVGYFAAHLIATTFYLKRSLPPSFIAHHLFFIAVLSAGAMWCSDAAPRILIWAFLQQATGITFHFMTAFRGTQILSPRTYQRVVVADYLVFALIRALYFPVLAIVFCVHAATEPRDFFDSILFPLVFAVGTGFNLYWFLLKTKKTFPGFSKFVRAKAAAEKDAVAS